MIAALDFPPHILALVAGTFLIAGFVKGVVGMGFPTISVGVMTAAIGLQPALTLAVIPAIATNVWQALSGGHLGELLRRFWLFFLFAIVFTWVGVAIVVQFAHPTPWTLLNPLACCITPEHPQRFSGMVSADALDLVLYEINLVETARRVG